jgi:hypothetical protein
MSAAEPRPNTRNISRNGAKAAKKLIPELGALGVLADQSSVFIHSGRRQDSMNKHSNTEFTEVGIFLN